MTHLVHDFRFRLRAKFRFAIHLQIVVAALVLVGLAGRVGRAADQPSRLVFEAVKNTGLAEALKQRRAVLEQRAEGPLKSHAWWLWGLSAFDYDLDGDLDLIVCVHGSTNGVILRNNWKESGSITFTDVTKQLGVDGLVPSTDTYPLVWDFDGDGDLDIAGLLDDRSTPCLINQDGKRFTKASFSLHPINYFDAVEDINGDGYLDIYQTRRGKTIRMVYDAKTSRFIKNEVPAINSIKLPRDIVATVSLMQKKRDNRFMKLTNLHADLNSDGRPDLALRAFAGYGGDRMGWYLLADKNGTLTDESEAMGLPREGAPLLIKDLDRDGDVDVLIASSKVGGLYLNDGRGRFTYQASALGDFVKQRCPYLHVAFREDLDNDGDLDIAVSNRRYGTQKVFENQGDGRFALAFESRGWDADPLVLRDINGDGLIDLIIGGAGDKNSKENIGVFLNRTANTGTYTTLHMRMDKPNVYAVGTRVEVFKTGQLGKDGARPILTRMAARDGSPIHFGLGSAKSFDLRVTFPGGKVITLLAVDAKPTWIFTPNGMRETRDH